MARRVIGEAVVSFWADALQARLMVRLSIYTRVCSKLKDFEAVLVQK